ncbi:hypothetical protein CRUP_022069 [Coryphaenoides rupestris]|nr:hypothetical protein CRUP_022069 [Coryphaenoides rupestris]
MEQWNYRRQCFSCPECREGGCQTAVVERGTVTSDTVCNSTTTPAPVPATTPQSPGRETQATMHHKYAVDAHEQTCLMETSPALSNAPKKSSVGMEAPRDVEQSITPVFHVLHA